MSLNGRSMRHGHPMCMLCPMCAQKDGFCGIGATATGSGEHFARAKVLCNFDAPAYYKQVAVDAE